MSLDKKRIAALDEEGKALLARGGTEDEWRAFRLRRRRLVILKRMRARARRRGR